MASAGTSHVSPSTLEVNYDKNVTDLYSSITSCAWDKAIAKAKAVPEEARTWVVRYYDDDDDDDSLDNEEPEIMWRFLPIHSACARQPPAAVIAALLQAYPDGAKCVDDQGMYPLHYACGNQASREVIRSLLMSFPEAARMKDPRGMLPIHYLACWGPSSVSVIDMVLVAHRDVATATDADGNTPLDLAIDGDYSERDAVVAALKRWLENGAKNIASETPSRSSSRERAAPAPAASQTQERVTPQHTSSFRRMISSKASQEAAEAKKTESSPADTDENVVSNLEKIDSDAVSRRSRDGDDRSFRSFRRSTYSRADDSRSYNGDSYRRSPTKPISDNSPRKYASGTGSQRLYRSIERSNRDEKKEETTIAPSNPNERILCPRTPIPPMQIDCSTMTTEHMSSPRTVGLLHDEIEQLKEESKKSEDTWVGRFDTQESDFRERMEAMEAKVKELEMVQDQNNRQIAELQADVQERDAELKTTKENLADKTSALEKSQEESDGLRQTLADLTEQHNKFKRRSEIMQDRLGALNASLASMMEQQRTVLDATKAREEQYEELAKQRRAQLKGLLELDEKKVVNEDEDIKSCLVKQTKEMEAITAVIAAVRQG